MHVRTSRPGAVAPPPASPRPGPLAVLAAFAILAGTALPARAQPELAQQRNCLSCHSVEKKILGPAFKDVAAKYAGQPDAAAKLAAKVRAGGAGVWGVVPMPANPQVSEAEAKELVGWILTLK